MTKKRVCATAPDFPDRLMKTPHDMYHTRTYPEDAADKIQQIRGLARVGAAATDSALRIDLEALGYAQIFELIHRLTEEIWREIDYLQLETGTGTYANRAEEKPQ